MPRLTRLLKNLLKRALPYRQSLALYHRLRNRRTLTVVAFHRVLRRNDLRWAGALAEWTVSDAVFEECLLFFRRHYNLVGLHDLFACMRGGRRLPPRSLLVTFDDGYADNEEYALPLLLRHSVPVVLFLTSGFVNRHSRPWTEDLLSAYERGRVSREEVIELHRSLFRTRGEAPRDTSELLRDIRGHWTNLSDIEVETLCRAVLRQPLDRLTSPAQMLTSEQVKRMHAAGIAIGAHGRTHSSMPGSTDLDTELRQPRRTISNLLGLPSPDDINALAFPYGEYSEQVVTRALDAGYKLLFTFSSRLNPLPHGRLVSSVLDRVNVSEPKLAPDGATTPERLARYFFFLPRSRTIGIRQEAST
jgi:peptidoglycan/xylan/chitin deacetylase (PgdA/CDA1 family)